MSEGFTIQRIIELEAAAFMLGPQQKTRLDRFDASVVWDTLQKTWPDDAETVQLVGRRTMIGQILDACVGDQTFVAEWNEEMLRAGRLGQRQGCEIWSLQNYKDSEGQSAVDANVLWMLVDGEVVHLWIDTTIAR